MVEEGDGSGDSRGEVAAMRRQADGAEQQRDGERARRRLVFEREDGGPGDQRAQRADGGDQERRGEGESERLRHQEQAPDAERARGDLLGGEHLAEAGAA